MVLACDGIWDCLTNQEVATFIRKHVANGVKLPEICERLMDNCLADQSSGGGIGCDNMTVEIVAFLNGQTEEEWYDKIKKEVVGNDSSVSSSNNGEPELKKHRGMVKSESRQYSVNELKNAPDLTSSLVDDKKNEEEEKKKEETKVAEEQ